VRGRGVGAKQLDHREAVGIREDQVLEDHRRADLVGARHRLRRVLAEVQRDVGLRRQQQAERRADEALVVHEQHGDPGFRGLLLHHPLLR
jgi:hypothetical protein